MFSSDRVSSISQDKTRASVSPFQKRMVKRIDYGLRSEQVRNIIKESFQMFRNCDLPDKKLQEYEERVFCGALFLSPRSAAKAILELMDMFTIEEITQTQTHSELQMSARNLERGSVQSFTTAEPEIRSHSIK